MELWLSLVNSESENGTFEFVHNSTASVVKLSQVTPSGEPLSDFWMNYSELCELHKFLNHLFNEENQTT